MHSTIQSVDMAKSIGVGNKREMPPILLVHEQKPLEMNLLSERTSLPGNRKNERQKLELIVHSSN